ncbi:MAG: DUF2073 domain-containing protein [Methanoregulaceae archaeon]|nr:DUF2073 domain-containing protein [Methanoregulaceae archaeon]
MMQGIQIDLISEERLADLTSMERIRLILDRVREGTIVILERGLAPEEQSRLVEMTMQEILPDGFNGIEIESYPAKAEETHLIARLLGRKPPTRLTVIGPANHIRMIRKDKDLISAWISTG